MRLKTRFPTVSRWMIGRGLATDPFLVERIRSEAPHAREAARLKGFLDDIVSQANEELYGPASVLGRMKELWGYLHGVLRQGERVWNGVKICRTVEEYQRVVEGLFAAFPGFAEDETLSGIDEKP
jgi:tRNA-dihydrouridine synthase